jgi:hypothetical protein
MRFTSPAASTTAFARAEIERDRAVGAVVAHEELDHHRAHEHRGLALAHPLAQAFLEVGAVEVDVVGARQAERAQAVVGARLPVLEVDAERFDLAKDARHLLDHAARDRHVDDVVGELRHVPDEERGRVPVGPGVHHGEIVIDPAADAAAAVEHLALLADDDLEARLERRYCGHRACHSAADDQEVGIQGGPLLHRCSGFHGCLVSNRSREA